MDHQRERILDDLRGLIDGLVRCDDLFLQLYASDASIYQVRPMAVVCPSHSDDVVACTQYAAENGLPIHARGAGTGLAGESLGGGLVLDFSRSMQRILRVDDRRVRLQPGVVHARLNRTLAERSMIFGPDPAMSAVTTMGGVIGVDSAGSHWLQYGSARRHVESLQVVLADGTRLELGNEPLERADDPFPQRRRLVREVASLIRRSGDLLAEHSPRSPVNRCGYQLNDVLTDTHLDLAKLLTGSAGTLALTTEATVGIEPDVRYRAVALLLFGSMENAARAVTEVVAFSPAACDLMDRRHVSLAREHDVRFDLLIPAETEAVLLVEFAGDDMDEVRDSLRRMIDRLWRRKKLAFGARHTIDPTEVELYWGLARHVVPTLYRLKGSSRPLPFVEDLAVPPAALPGFLTSMQNVFKKHQATFSLFGHAGHGQLHVRPFLDLASSADVRRMEQIAAELYEQVWLAGGTISGEHGDGFSRTQFIRRQYGPLYDSFRDLKQIFDPNNLLNPGKVIGGETDALTKHLRPVTFVGEKESAPDSGGAPAGRELLGTVELQLNWNLDQVSSAARNCNGCGACRSQLPDVRMCPIFRASPREEASPRAKANLMRGVLSGELPPEAVASEEFKALADLCVNCHQCRSECPANVDIPSLMTEAKGAYVAVNGLRPRDSLLIRLGGVGKWGSAVSPLSNWALGNRTARWLLERFLGIAQGRKLPRFAPRPFARQAARRRLNRLSRGSEAKVVYFTDTYANYFDPQLAEAFVAIMEHHGVSVYVPPGLGESGMALITEGAIDRAKRLAVHNVEILAEAVRLGYHVVATEPSAALALTHEYLALLDDDEARLVAENTSEACNYLWRMHQQGKLQLDFKPVNANLLYHLPCHQKALGFGAPGEHLLRLIPGMKVTRAECGCSGMAGLYGVRKQNYRSSLRAGFDLIGAVRDPRYQAGTTECTACKMQMEQGTTKPTFHPLKVLALAYGLLPEGAALLTRRGQELVTT